MIFEKDGKQYEGTEINSGNMDIILKVVGERNRGYYEHDSLRKKWVLWAFGFEVLAEPFTLSWDDLKSQCYVAQKYEWED